MNGWMGNGWIVGGVGVIVALTAVGLTDLVRRAALRRGIVAVPNARSSHAKPVPHIGGLSIVLLVLLGELVLLSTVPLETPWFRILAVSGALIVVVGLVDDLVNLRKRIRILIHLLAAGLIVLWIGSKIEIVFPRALELTGPLAVALVILYVMWNINAYNFMDGIDGLAGGQAVFVGVTAGTIAWFNGNRPLAVTYFLVAAASLGYLRWNWHPAKIFMGDLCSGFLGVTFAVLSLWGKMTSSVPLSAFLILMAVFYTDSTWTTLRRFIEGENPTTTHRDFAFHHAIRKGHSHGRVTGAILLIDVLWLAPLAVLVTLLASPLSIPVVVIAYIPVFAAVLALKAGVRLRDGQDPRDMEANGKG